MHTYTRQAYQQFVAAGLAQRKRRLMAELKAILQSGRELPAKRLDVVISAQSALKNIPIALDFIGSDEAPLPGGSFRLDHLPGLASSPADEETVYQFDDHGVETLEVELQALTDWFADCWQAVAANYPLPAFIGIEDDLEALDLATLTWVPNPRLHRQGC